MGKYLQSAASKSNQHRNVCLTNHFSMVISIYVSIKNFSEKQIILPIDFTEKFYTVYLRKSVTRMKVCGTKKLLSIYINPNKPDLCAILRSIIHYFFTCLCGQKKRQILANDIRGRGWS